MAIQKSTIKFLEDLKKNNKRDWFLDHKKEYEAARADFTDFIADLLGRMSKFEPALAKLEPKDTFFRINRDVRFSKDKSPYKVELGSHINPNPGGKKSDKPGYWFRIGAGNLNGLASGLMMPEPKQLAKVREYLSKGDNAKALRKIVGAKAFKDRFGGIVTENALKTAPRGFPKDHPDLDLLKLKSYYAHLEFKQKDAYDAKFAQTIAGHFKAIKPLNDYLLKALK